MVRVTVGLRQITQKIYFDLTLALDKLYKWPFMRLGLWLVGLGN